jgi:hypothetical protein
MRWWWGIQGNQRRGAQDSNSAREHKMKDYIGRIGRIGSIRPALGSIDFIVYPCIKHSTPFASLGHWRSLLNKMHRNWVIFK